MCDHKLTRIQIENDKDTENGLFDNPKAIETLKEVWGTVQCVECKKTLYSFGAHIQWFESCD